MILEKQLIFKHKPVLNEKNKYKISNKLYQLNLRIKNLVIVLKLTKKLYKRHTFRWT